MHSMMREEIWLRLHGFGLHVCAIIKQGPVLVQIEQYKSVGSNFPSSYVDLSFVFKIVSAGEHVSNVRVLFPDRRSRTFAGHQYYIVIVQGRAVLLNFK